MANMSPPFIKRVKQLAKEGRIKEDASRPPVVNRVIRETNKDPVDPQGTNIKAKKSGR